MNKAIGIVILLALVLALTLRAQTNMPARLAIVSETDDTAAAADLLTAQLSSQPNIQLLERDQITRVYREQSLSKANTDYLKLGQVLGADGLLLLEKVQEGGNQFLRVRLVAVKPGVMLEAERFDWARVDPVEWPAAFARHLKRNLAKLAVPKSAAIPLSVINLRSAASSKTAEETDRQLQLLTIERLSQQPELFVLERQKMSMLGEEKARQTDDSAFWNGSWLLEGVVDQNGYSQDTMTVDIRLAPPHGGAPVAFAVSGSRTNLPEIIDQLVAGVNRALKINATVPPLDATAEAAQFCEEARWALRWNVLPEAAAAAEAAWALGKQDLDTALLRMRAALADISAVSGGYRYVQMNRAAGFYANGMSLPRPATFATVISRQEPATNPAAITPADPKNLDRATEMLALYEQMSHTALDAERPSWSYWQDSAWSQAGIDALIVAVHARHQAETNSQAKVTLADNLAELDAAARAAALLITNVPLVQGNYYLPNAWPAERDELARRIALIARESPDNSSDGWAKMAEINVIRTDYGEPRTSAPPKQPSPALQPAGAPPTIPATLPFTANAAPSPVPGFTNSAATELFTNIITINHFLPIPLAGLPGNPISAVNITAHHWLADKLVLDFEYNTPSNTFDARGNWQQTRISTLPAIAVLDPATEHWEVVGCPPGDASARNNFYDRTVLLHGDIFNCEGGQLQKYNFQKQKWQTLAVSSGENYELFAVDDRLYAANRNQIMEITDGGSNTRLLASNRRQPPVSMLDTVDLGNPVLLAGPNHSLRVMTSDNLFTWAGNDWQVDGTVQPAQFAPGFSPDGMLFRHSAGMFGTQQSMYRLLTGTALPELCFGMKSRPGGPGLPGFSPPGDAPTDTAKPLWRLPSGYMPGNLAAALDQSNVCLLAGHSEMEKTTNADDVIHEGRVLDRDGYNAMLMCFVPGLPKPQIVSLKFDAPEGRPPLGGVTPEDRRGISGLPAAWLLFAGQHMLVASELPVGSLGGGGGGTTNYQAGVWMSPSAPLEAACARQQASQWAQLAAEAQAMPKPEEIRARVLAKYDTNHNGVIDLKEREAALEDPEFIAFALNDIDTDHSVCLEPDELAWFDANQDKRLESREQTAIETAQRLLAKRLFDQFDPDGTGLLDRHDYDALIHAGVPMRANAQFYNTYLRFESADTNHDRNVDLGELENMFQQLLEAKLRMLAMRSANFNGPPGMGGRPATTPRAQFRRDVEAYWENPQGFPQHGPYMAPSPFGPGFRPPGMPPGMGPHGGPPW